MEFIRSQIGAAKLCYEGFSYTKKKETKSTIRWECSQRRSENCKGTDTSDNPCDRQTDRQTDTQGNSNVSQTTKVWAENCLLLKNRGRRSALLSELRIRRSAP
ncbi:hypothetical protein DPMN_032725 [Dreissena polymorpha]|uniref:FLYWCH-type domain-containing protein n=1 Tax=Dreissena polymorpha TaxID=45954 RepID=A0A9D4M4Q6_DREPO|nr:hypothetical protein DPMN_032725 [Dreissena polymorpha]